MTSRRKRARRATEPVLPAPARIRGPGDLVVATPYLLGFRPESSLVLLATGGPRRQTRMTARVDLPPESAPAAELGPYLTGLCQAVGRAGAEQVSVLVYPGALEDPALHGLELPRRDLVEALGATFARGGLEVVEALCVVATDDGQERYWSYLCSWEHCCPREGTVTDERTGTDVRLAFVGVGRAPRRDRAELVASLAPADEEDPAAAVLNIAVEAATEAFVEQVLGCGPNQLAALRRWRRRTATRLDAALRAAALDPAAGRLDVDTQALLVVALLDLQVRDLLVAEALRGERLPELGDALTPLVRRVRSDALAPVAATQAMVSYLRGDGALAWVAVDRALADDPEHPLASLLARSLAAGLPPDSLQECVSALPPVAGWNGAPVPAPTAAPGPRTGTGPAPAPRRPGGRRAG